MPAPGRFPEGSLWPPEPRGLGPQKCQGMDVPPGSCSNNATALTPQLGDPDVHALQPSGSPAASSSCYRVATALEPTFLAPSCPTSPPLQEELLWGHVPNKLLALELLSWVLLLGVSKLRQGLILRWLLGSHVVLLLSSGFPVR